LTPISPRDEDSGEGASPGFSEIRETRLGSGGFATPGCFAPPTPGREVFGMERYQDLEDSAVGLINAVIN
jgi:hypothetical protein